MCWVGLLTTHPYSSDQLRRSHIMQYCCGYCIISWRSSEDTIAAPASHGSSCQSSCSIPSQLLQLAISIAVLCEKVCFRSQILEHPSIGEYWNISGEPVLPKNVIFMFFRTYWWDSEANDTGMPKWSGIVQYLCTRIWNLKYTFSVLCYVRPM